MTKSRKNKRGGAGRRLDDIEISLLAIMQRKAVARQKELVSRAANLDDDASVLSGSYTTYYNNGSQIERYKCFIKQVLGINIKKDRRFIVMLLTYAVRILNTNKNEPFTITTYNGDQQYKINTNLTESDNTELLLGNIDSILSDFTIEPFQIMKWFEIRIYAMVLSVIAKFLEIDRDVKTKKTPHTETFDPEKFFGTSLYNILLNTQDYREQWGQMEQVADKLIDDSLNVFARFVEQDLAGVIDTNRSLIDNYKQFELLFTAHIKSGILYRDLTESYPTFPIDLFRVISSATVSPVYMVSFKNQTDYSVTFNNKYDMSKEQRQQPTDTLFFDKLIQTINDSQLTLPPSELEQKSLEYGSSSDKRLEYEPETRFPRTSLFGKLEKGTKKALQLGPNATKVVGAVSDCLGAACERTSQFMENNPRVEKAAIFVLGAVALAAVQAAKKAAQDSLVYDGGAKSRKRPKTKKLRTKTKRHRKSRL